MYLQSQILKFAAKEGTGHFLPPTLLPRMDPQQLSVLLCFQFPIDSSLHANGQYFCIDCLGIEIFSVEVLSSVAISPAIILV